jgi:hypothetical protein
MDPAGTSNLNALSIGSITATEYYANGWFRNNNAQQGLYNTATGRHFYSRDGSYWVMASANGMQIRNSHEGTITGYLHWDGTAGSNSFGLLSPNGNWRVRVDNSNTELYGSWLLAPQMQAPIYYDRDNTAYYLNPNGDSNISRLYATADIRSPILYDSNNTAYYLDPNGTSRVSTLQSVAVITPSVGSGAGNGFYWPTNPGGGSWDEAWMRYYVESGENTKFQIGINNDADDDIEFYQAGGARMNIYDSKVGIGIQTPGARLTVINSGTNPGAYDDGKALFVSGTWGTGQSYDGGVEFRHDNLSQGIGFGYNTIYQTGTNANQDLNLISKGSGPLTLNAYGGATGNVGIKTTSPSYTLDVQGDIRAGSGNLYDNNGQRMSASTMYANRNNTTGGGIWISDDGGFYDDNDAWIKFKGSTGIHMNGYQIAGLTKSAGAVSAWSVNRTSYLNMNGLNWTTIPGMQITFTLDRAALVQMVANGTQRCTSGNCHIGYRYNVDGAARGDGTWGERIHVNNVNNAWWSTWTMNGFVSLAAGSHTIYVQATSAGSGYQGFVCGESGGGLQGYTNCTFNITAIYQ